MRKRSICALLAALLVWASLGVRALAAGEAGHSLTLSLTPGGVGQAGVEFSLYRVAEVHTDRVSFTPLPPYSGYHVLENTSAGFLTRAATLATYVRRDRLPADAVAVTDEGGVAIFSGLPQGLYLVLGARSHRGSVTYTPVPCLLSLPNTQDGSSWSDDLWAEMKYTQSSSGLPPSPSPAPTTTSSPTDLPGPSGSPEPAQTTQLHVLKVWADDGYENQRPAEVRVDLLREGKLYDTVALSSANSWRHTWSGLDAAWQWQVVEQEEPNYLPALTQGAQAHVITNTYLEVIEAPDVPLLETPDLSVPPEASGAPSPSGEPGSVPSPALDGPDAARDKLPQTGLVWWPVPVLLLAGLALILAGLIRRRGGRGHEK